MKIENVKNNINGSTYSSTPTTKINMLRVRVDDHIDPNKRNRGITLIALIITIIIMLILVGVVLTLSIGETGLFNTAKYAAKKWNNSVEQENVELDELYAYINGESLPENTKDTVAGTLVAVPDGWKTSTPTYVATSDGKEVISSKKISTVQAVATGEGETVPVPLGFYYVGGKVRTGVVISDRKEDQNKYKNETEIPSGIEAVLNEDGTVKEIKETLLGNQFVWVPCKEEEYVKTNWGQGNVTNRSNSCWDTSLDRLGELQTKKYGGFYVARFEAGLPDNIEETKERQQDTGSNQTYNKSGRPQSKAGIVPWNFIDWNKSRENANSMYNTEYVNSGLITGTQWDVMINWMTDKNSTELTSSGTFGNYANVTPTTTLGRTSYGFVSGSYWYQDPFTDTWVKDATRQAGTASKVGYAWTTGASNEARKKNLYDVAGNMWEWTEETSFYGGNSATQYRVLRGGSFANASSTYPVCYRHGNRTVSSTDLNVGFRAVLYIK